MSFAKNDEINSFQKHVNMGLYTVIYHEWIKTLQPFMDSTFTCETWTACVYLVWLLIRVFPILVLDLNRSDELD